MPNKVFKSTLFAAIVGAVIAIGPALKAAELSTLFTTPQERKLINANRYKTDQTEAVTVEVETEDGDNSAMQRMLMEEVTFVYKVSGITLSQDGPHTVWINNLAYEDGAKLPDNSTIKVMVGRDTRVRITAPDGTSHYATSGESLDVTYLAPIEERS